MAILMLLSSLLLAWLELWVLDFQVIPKEKKLLEEGKTYWEANRFGDFIEMGVFHVYSCVTMVAKVYGACTERGMEGGIEKGKVEQLISQWLLSL